jgi:hypothetical protein
MRSSFAAAALALAASCDSCAIPCAGDDNCPAQLPVCAGIVDGVGVCTARGDGEGEKEGDGEGEGEGEGEKSEGEGEGEGDPALFVALADLPPTVFDGAIALDGLDVVAVATAPPPGYTGNEPLDLVDYREGLGARTLTAAVRYTQTGVVVDPSVGVRGFGVGYDEVDGYLLQNLLFDAGDASELIESFFSISNTAVMHIGAATVGDTVALGFGLEFVALLYLKGPDWSVPTQLATNESGAVWLSSSSLATVACLAGAGRPQLVRFTGDPPWSGPLDVDTATVADGNVRCAVDEDSSAALVYRTDTELVLARVSPADDVVRTTLAARAYAFDRGPRSAAVALFDGGVHIAYVDALDADQARVIYRAPDAAEETVVAGAIFSAPPTILVDATGRVVIAFVDRGTEPLQIVRR